MFTILSTPKISVLRFAGIIKDSNYSGISLNSMNKYIEQAFFQSNLKAVFFIINSPGGSPVQSELITNRIEYLSKKKSIPIYTFIEDIGASGGYWLACVGNKIMAMQNSIIGSIGVVSTSFGFQGAIKKFGIERRIYSQGKNKILSDPFLSKNQNGIAVIKRMQKNIHESFINYVKLKRSTHLLKSKDIEIFDGSVWTGKEAQQIGLVDEIQDMFSFANKNFAKNVKFKFINKKEPWIKRKLGVESSGLSSVMEDFLNTNKHIKHLY